MSIRSCLRVSTSGSANVTVLTVSGVLDGASYLGLRDEILTAAVAGPNAIVLDVSELTVPAASAWTVFVNAHCQINAWREMPMALACRHQAGREAIWRNGLTRNLALYSSVSEAVADVPCGAAQRRCACTDLTAMPDSVARSRHLISTCLTQWSKAEFIAAASTVATVFIENFIAETQGSSATLRIETDGTSVSVALDDPNPEPAELHEICAAVPGASGKEIVRILSRKWGSIATGSGKTMWAVIGPAN